MSRGWNLLTRRALHRASQVGVGLIARGFSPRGSAGAKYGVAAQTCLARLPPLARNGAHSQKKRDARLFLPPGLCTRCDVVEESATHFAREATIAGSDSGEIITLEFQSKVTFFQAAGPREGAIINELFVDAAGALQLRFYCYLGLRDKELNGLKSKPNKLS